MTAALAFAAGAVVAAVAVHHTHRHRVATALADRDDALDQLAREQSLRLYAERSLDHWLDQAARLEKAARR